MLNYFGQGALLLSDAGASRNPFYLLAPDWARLPLLGLATMAAIIASQAIISGSFSLTRQAIQLGYLPRIEIIHTSASEIGQIYVPAINWLLAIGTVGVVVGFGTSSNVASAYGVALTTTMLITTLLASLVTVKIWRWNPWLAGLVTALFLVPDLAFWTAAMLKIPDGGWFPLAVALLALALLTSWEQGRSVLSAMIAGRLLPIEAVLEDLARSGIQRTRGTAVYLTSDEIGTPIALLHNLKINRVVHERNLFLTIRGEEVPYVPSAERLEIRELRPGFLRAVARYGFLEDPDVPALLSTKELQALGIRPQETYFVLSRNELLPSRRGTMTRWRRRLFVLLYRNSVAPWRFFRLPPNQVLELGMQIEI